MHISHSDESCELDPFTPNTKPPTFLTASLWRRVNQVAELLIRIWGILYPLFLPLKLNMFFFFLNCSSGIKNAWILKWIFTDIISQIYPLNALMTLCHPFLLAISPWGLSISSIYHRNVVRVTCFTLCTRLADAKAVFFLSYCLAFVWLHSSN